MKQRKNKKVLLRERKRHTARRVVTTPSVVLTGYPPHPDLAGAVPPWAGYPPSRVPAWGTVPPGRIPPPGWTWQGTPPPPWQDLAGYPPPPVSVPWHSGKCCKALWDMGTPPPPCGQTD